MKAVMKAMKAMKSKVAKGPRAKYSVMCGNKTKTSGGLTKAMLVKNKRGKIVSKKAAAAGKKNFKNISGWVKAMSKARVDLGLSGFIAVNGKTPEGKALYAKAKSIYNTS